MSLFGSLAQTVLLKAYPFRAGRKELIRALARRYDTPFLWSGDWGIRYLLRTRNFLDQSLARDGHYEAAAVDGLCWQINRRGVDLFLDIGAASGIYSLTVARRTGCRDIVAFEPDPYNLGQLYANVFLNGLTERIQVIQCAVSDTTGRAVLQAQRDERALSTHRSTLAVVNEPGRVALTVETVRLDDFLGAQGRRIAIKMDIEGHEAEALAGMRRLLASNDVLLQIELMPRIEHEARAQLAALGLVELPPPLPNSRDFLFASKAG